MQNPVSIIMPTFNSEEFITKSIQSVLKQTHKNWELIVIDDYSTDDTVNIVKFYKSQDSRIKLVELKNNVGAAIARNKALNIANNKFIAFLDSDDLWHPQKLELQLNFMKKNNYAFTFTSYQRISRDGTKNFNTIRVPGIISYKKLLKNTIIGTLTVIIDREKVGELKMNNIRNSQDMTLWCNILKRGFHAYGLDKILASYRVVNKYNITKKIKGAKGVWKVYRKIEKICYTKSIYYFIHYAVNSSFKRMKIYETRNKLLHKKKGANAPFYNSTMVRLKQ